MIRLIERLRGFQEYLLELGVARSVLALPAPRMLSLPAPSSGEHEPENLFGLFVTEPEIVGVARDLFVSGFYNQAVCEALKALDKAVQKAARITGKSGTSLMTQVFSEVSPVLVWSARISQSEKDEHNGYQRLFAGAMLGIRNPCAHEHHWVDDPETALECVVLCQHLLRKVKAATLAAQA